MKKSYFFLVLPMLLCVLFCSCRLSGQERKEQPVQNAEAEEKTLPEELQNQGEQQEGTSGKQDSNRDATAESAARNELPLDEIQTTDFGEASFGESQNQQESAADVEEKEKSTVIELPIIPFQP